MAAISDGANKQIDMHGPGLHGFSSGDANAKAKASEMTPKWCNRVQQEINNGIAAGGITPNGDNDNELAAAIETIAIEVAPRTSGKTEATFIMDTDVAAGGPADTWGERKKTGRVKDLVGGGAAFALLTLDNLPNNSYCDIAYTVVIVDASDKSRRSSEKGFGTFERGTSAATSSLGLNSADHNEMVSIFPAVYLTESASGYPVVTVDPSGLSPIKNFNLVAVATCTVVTES